MSETSQKRSRKSKLVPRSLKDGDDLDNLQDEPKNKISKFNNIDAIQNEPTTSSYQPLQFDIKIEVEACDEDDFNDTTADFIQDPEYKTEIINENDLFEVEERDINSLLAQALSKKKGRQKSSNSDGRIGNTLALAKDHDYLKGTGKIVYKRNSNLNRLPKSWRQSTSTCHLQLDEDAVMNALDDLSKGDMSVAEKILAIEMRNMWGRCRLDEREPTMPEKRIQIALNTWKYWKVSFKGDEVPLMYKCYICEKAWWHLGPFQDHVAIHEEDLRVESESQAQTMQYNIVAFSAKSNHVFKDFKIDSNCWRCGSDFEHHVIEKLYTCEHCSLTFQTCTRFLAHKAACVTQLRLLVRNGPFAVFTCHICQLKLLQKESLKQHYLDYHDVRSDLPMFVDVRSCTTCSRNYLSLPFHYCTKKNYSIMCIHCAKRFPSKVALDIHMEEASDYPCVVCGEWVPKRCMIAEHMLMHTDKFVQLRKCLSCKDCIVLPFDEESLRRHKIIWHKQKVDKRRNYFETVLAPRKFIEAQRAEMENSSATKPSADEKKQEPEKLIEVKKENASREPSIEVEIESWNAEEENIKETITLEDAKPSTSIQIKQELEEEFEEFNDSIVKEEIIEQMQKNNNFTEDDEGYEYILSSVFNASNSSVLEDGIAVEADDFEELINKELEKSIQKKPKKTKKTPLQNPSSSKQIKLAMVSRIEQVDPETVKKVVPRYKCDYQGCDFVGTEKEALREHRTSHKIVVVTCSKCNKPFSTYRGYLNHLTEHGYLKWSCPECFKSYSNFASLNSHVRIKAFRSFSKMQVYDKGGKMTVTFQCRKCGITVRRASILDHWEKHLGVGEPNVKVEIQEEDGEITVGEVMEHEEPDNRIPEDMDAETMERVIAALVQNNKQRLQNKTCVACGRAFERRNDCKRHHIEHLLANAYSTKLLYKGLRCQICSKTYDRPDGYKQHMRDHGHLPVCKCPLCFKTFSDSSNYVKHKKTHSSLYICDICKKKFQAKASLIKHMQVRFYIQYSLRDQAAADGTQYM
ncbi:hypothetical protein ABMA28_012610 [Loxostege sticticalis]|uniref:C2H2-type domain-containing protein n=1 Tax=Loxostege sticticalis TaxID=481309 RepID=A0ABD0S8A9_LOXSC